MSTALILLAAAAMAEPAATPLPPAATHHGSATATGAAKRSMVKLSSPADGAMLMEPPSVFEATFVHPMTLTGAEIVTADGSVIPVTATPERIDDSSGRVALPTLAPGTYRLKWVGKGGSGREMRGELGFMVH